MSRVVYGLHAVTELLRVRRGQGEIVALLVQHGEPQARGDSGIAALCREAQRLGLQPIERSRAELDSLAGGGAHQGVVAVCGEYRYAELEDLLDLAGRGGAAPLLLVLDGVTDPQNLGALVRSVHVLGGHGVIIPQDRAAPVTPAVVKASAGATELVPIARVTNLVRAMEELKARGIWLTGAVAGASHRAPPPWQADLRGPAGLLLGSEGKGLRKLVLRTCDHLVEVPMAGTLHGASLNVAAAGAVLLYEALRQRSAPAPGAPAA